MRCLIVDDEPIARRGMVKLVGSRSELSVAGVAADAREALAFLGENSVDLVFIDIEMPGLNGMELARRLPERCQVVFTTAYSDYACESYDVDATDYLMKPIDPDRFNHAVDKALTFAGMMAAAETPEPLAASASEEILTVKSDRRYVRLRVDEITFVEGLKDYLIIHTADRRIVTRMTVKSLEEALPPQFLRVGKSYIVNRDKIDSFDNNDLYIGSSVVPIGVSYKQEVLKILLGQ